MKPSSPASFLLVLHLAASAPLPAHGLPLGPCPAWLRGFFSPASASASASPSTGNLGPATPPTTLTDPHFPYHQTVPKSSSPESHRQIEEAFNNSPFKPLAQTHPTAALRVERPLESIYLLSIPSSVFKNALKAEPHRSSPALPAKPTSALPSLRIEDAIRYWATLSNPKGQGGDPAIAGSHAGPVPKCADFAKPQGTARLRLGRPIIMARQYSDLIVVGIVVLFLAAVAVMEALQYLADVSSILGFRTRGHRRRGEIFLEDDETSGVISRPICSMAVHTEALVPSDGNSESGQYDPNASEKV